MQHAPKCPMRMASAVLQAFVDPGTLAGGLFRPSPRFQPRPDGARAGEVVSSGGDASAAPFPEEVESMQSVL
eukprot:3969364-Lingulodinium_polyedra.AAC.1